VSAFAVAGIAHHARRIVILGNCADAAFPNVLGAVVFDATFPSHVDSWRTPVVVLLGSLLALALNILANGAFLATVDGDALGERLRPIAKHLPVVLLSCAFAGAVAAVYADSAAVGLGFAFAAMSALHYMARQIAKANTTAREIAELAESRRALAADAAHAEERERRRIAERLHDGVLQNLLAARQDMNAAARGDGARLGTAQATVQDAVRELRQTVAQLHPAATRAAGVAATLRAIAQEEARRGRFAVTVSVSSHLPGTHDRLLVGVSRELLANASRHAGAQTVELTANMDDGFVVLEVADDGRGMTQRDRDLALAAGHIDLASLRERIEAVGGSVHVTSPTENGAGTQVTVRLPLE
jgi:signal transduction histidine kinase